MIAILPISPTGTSTGQLVIDDEGRWAVTTATGPLPLSDRANLVGALPLLEAPFHEFRRRLEQAIRDTNAGLEADSFPASALVRFALESPSSYWIELALGWAEQLAGPGSELLAALDTIVQSRRQSPVRRKAKRIRDALRGNAIGLYTRVRLRATGHEAEGVRRGMLGYVIEVHPDDRYEVEFSNEAGETLALLVLATSEIAPAPEKCEPLTSLMRAFLASPSLANAQTLEVELQSVAETDGDDAQFLEELAAKLAQYRPEGGDHLYSAKTLLGDVMRALKRLELG